MGTLKNTNLSLRYLLNDVSQFNFVLLELIFKYYQSLTTELLTRNRWNRHFNFSMLEKLLKFLSQNEPSCIIPRSYSTLLLKEIWNFIIISFIIALRTAFGLILRQKIFGLKICVILMQFNFEWIQNFLH